MLIDSRELWVAGTNCYVVAPERGGLAVVVDAPPDPDAIGALLRAHELTPVALLLTHAHIDHLGGAGSVARSFEVSAYLHPDDAWLAESPEEQLRSLFGMVPPGDYAPPDRYVDLADRAELDLAGVGLTVLHTPGHTPGHCCFLLESEGILFSGDQLFAGSVGRTDLPGGDWDTLLASMASKVLTLADDIEVLPGHGPATTIGHERRTNPFLQGLA
ncbi:MAG: MBL fold metallo-hydrolase [Acidimicrobiia bacterium]|nr:MBL fold metallo-hydrolase [Acidimicrobiia bacterium]